jgi:hypothetical protein
LQGEVTWENLGRYIPSVLLVLTAFVYIPLTLYDIIMHVGDTTHLCWRLLYSTTLWLTYSLHSIGNALLSSLLSPPLAHAARLLHLLVSETTTNCKDAVSRAQRKVK